VFLKNKRLPFGFNSLKPNWNKDPKIRFLWEHFVGKKINLKPSDNQTETSFAARPTICLWKKGNQKSRIQRIAALLLDRIILFGKWNLNSEEKAWHPGGCHVLKTKW